MMSIEKQLKLLHNDGYLDTEETLRDYTSGKTEFDWLRTFAFQVNFDAADVLCDQFRALWTAYCLHNWLDCDTRPYDNDLLTLWHLVEKKKPASVDWSDFDSFDLYMGQYLC